MVILISGNFDRTALVCQTIRLVTNTSEIPRRPTGEILGDEFKEQWNELFLLVNMQKVSQLDTGRPFLLLSFSDWRYLLCHYQSMSRGVAVGVLVVVGEGVGVPAVRVGVDV